MRRAIYAGSFDPLTNGHLWMIEKGTQLFDELVVAVGINPKKTYTFSLEERVELVRASTQSYPNLKVALFENKFLVRYARSIHAAYLLRGIRSDSDLEYEMAMRHMNEELEPTITTVFLTPPLELGHLSSSLVKQLIGPEGWEDILQDYVPEPVYKKFLEKYGRCTNDRPQ